MSAQIIKVKPEGVFIKARISPEKARQFLAGRKEGQIILGANPILATIYLKRSGAIRVQVYDQKVGQSVQQWVENIGRLVENGQIFKGLITRVMDFGVFVAIAPYKDGMVYISDLSLPDHFDRRLDCLNCLLSVGGIISVKVISIDSAGHIRLTAQV